MNLLYLKPFFPYDINTDLKKTCLSLMGRRSNIKTESWSKQCVHSIFNTLAKVFYHAPLLFTIAVLAFVGYGGYELFMSFSEGNLKVDIGTSVSFFLHVGTVLSVSYLCCNMMVDIHVYPPRFFSEVLYCRRR